MRRVLLTLAAAVAGIVLPATNALTGPAAAAPPVTPNPGSIGIRLVEVPAEAADDPRARIYITDHLSPRTVIHRRISVSNLSDATRRITLYPGAAMIEGGSFNVAPGHTANELTTWITVDQPSLTLPPHKAGTVTATIAVPRDASPGEHYAAIWAETAQASQARSQNVIEVSRVGVRVYLSIGPGGAPPADFTITSLSSTWLTDGRPVTTAQIHNTGGRALDLTGDLTLTHGPGGLSAGPFPAQLGRTLAPGQSEPIKVTLDRQLPGGQWTALFRLKSGLTERTARAVLVFRPGKTTPGSGRSLSSRGSVAAIAVGTALLAAVLACTLHRRRRRGSSGGKPAEG